MTRNPLKDSRDGGLAGKIRANRPVPDLFEPRGFGGGGDGDPAAGFIRVSTDVFKQADHPFQQSLRGFVAEQIATVFDGKRFAVGEGNKKQAEVELGGTAVRRMMTATETSIPRVVDGNLLVVEHDLCERWMVARPVGLQRMDDRLERNVLVLLHVERGGAEVLKHVGQGRAAVHRESERQGVHQRSHERFGFVAVAVCDRDRHHEIIARSVSAEQQQICREIDHERRHTVGAREVRDGKPEVRRQLPLHEPA